jgi:methenyltetrahydrofolate cyclohydrolase
VRRMDEAEGKLVGLPLGVLLDDVAARTTAPGGGAVTGVVAALAGALVQMSVRFSAGDVASVVARAEELRTRAVSLAQDDLAVYAAYVRARREGRGADDMAAALDEATRVPLEMVEVAAELAQLASVLALTGNLHLRGDSTTAVLMGAAAARAGAVLVCENLADRSDDPRLGRVAALVASAGAAEQAVLSTYPPLTPPLPLT